MKKKQVIYKLMRRTPIRDIKAVSFSPLAGTFYLCACNHSFANLSFTDNFIVLHVPEYDNVFDNERKTEIVTSLAEAYKAITNSALRIDFTEKYYPLPRTNTD